MASERNAVRDTEQLGEKAKSVMLSSCPRELMFTAVKVSTVK